MSKEATQLLNRIQTLLDQEKGITDADVDYSKEYIERGRELNKQGRFHPAQASRLESMDWDGFNFRYGVKSITGFLSELIAVSAWNATHPKELMVLAAEDRTDQINGIDVIVSSDDWAHSYTGQVKTFTLNAMMDVRFEKSTATMKFIAWKDWVQYETIHVDRLILVDVETNFVVSFDYKAFKAYVAWPLFDKKTVELDLLTMKINQDILKLKVIMG